MQNTSCSYAHAVTGVHIVVVYLLWKSSAASLCFCIGVVLRTRSQVAGERQQFYHKEDYQ